MYQKNRCRCEECGEFYRKYRHEMKQRRTDELEGPDDPRHGMPVTYQMTYCRCQRCCLAQSLYMQLLKKERAKPGKRSTQGIKRYTGGRPAYIQLIYVWPNDRLEWLAGK